MKKVGIVIGGVVLLLLGYVFYLKTQAQKLADTIQYKLQRFKVKGVGLKNIHVTSELVITNPTSVAFTITDYVINVEIQGNVITTLKGGGSSIVIASNQSTTIPLDVQFDPRKIGQNLLPILLDVFVTNTNKTTDFGMRYVGTLSGKFGGLGFTNLPIDFTYTP